MLLIWRCPTRISNETPTLLLDVSFPADHCCNYFSIFTERLLSDPFHFIIHQSYHRQHRCAVLEKDSFVKLAAQKRGTGEFLEYRKLVNLVKYLWKDFIDSADCIVREYKKLFFFGGKTSKSNKHDFKLPLGC